MQKYILTRNGLKFEMYVHMYVVVRIADFLLYSALQRLLSSFATNKEGCGLFSVRFEVAVPSTR